MSDDPFEELDDGDADVDPFEELDTGDGVDASDGDDPAAPGDPDGSDDEPLDAAEHEEADPDLDVELDVEAGTVGASFESDPFEELEEGEPAEDAFERMEVEDLDEDVWAALDAGDVEIGGEASPVDGADEPTDHVVDKRKYCQRCPYFTDPPELACEHEGTEIVEVVDSEQFRVRECPMVTEEGPEFDRGA